MVYESIGHGNDVTCHAVPVFLFLVFRKKKKNVIVKNKSTTILYGLNSMTPQNVQYFAVKTLACGLWFHLSFEHSYDVISMVYKSVDHGKLWSIC